MGNSSPQEEPRKPDRRVQFSVKHLLGVFVALSVFLALVTQLRHIGFVASCFLAGIIIGWRWRRWRLSLASLTALLVFVLTYIASWLETGTRAEMDRSTYVFDARGRFAQVGEALANYESAQGGYPASLEELPELRTREFRFGSSGELIDFLGNVYVYQKKPNGYEFAWLGRDGVAGGVGLDDDVFMNDEMRSFGERLPLWQFLFQADGSNSVFLAALVASLAAGSMWFSAVSELSLSKKWLIMSVIVTVCFAVVVGAFLAAFHVAASQSGH